MADVALNGRDATPEMIVRVANGEAVTVDSDSLDRVARAYAVLLQGAKEGQEIYGLTVGVGWNKDRKMVDATDELISALRCSAKAKSTIRVAACRPPRA